jgi:hypothetical protein
MNTEIAEEVIDIYLLTEQGQPIPAAHRYKVRIDAREFEVHTRHPSVEQLIALVDRKLCAFELIELLPDDNRELEPGDAIDLHQHGLHGFITAHRENVTIFIKGKPFEIKRGGHKVDQILALVGQTSAGYNLYEEKPGHPPMPVPEGSQLGITGCEVFSYQVKAGTSS